MRKIKKNSFPFGQKCPILNKGYSTCHYSSMAKPNLNPEEDIEYNLLV